MSQAVFAERTSGWTERLPPGWSECHMRWLAQLYAGGTPDKSKDHYWTGGTIPWLNSGSVNQGLITEPSAHISEQGFQNSSARWVPSGALVMALAGQGKTKGTVAQLAIEATCNQSMAAIVPYGLDARYLYYWLASNYRRIRSGASDDLRDGLNLQMLGDIPCPVPPTREEQACIANFLDTQAARLDALIGEKERLVETMFELKRSVLHAVVSGCAVASTNAEKKPSSSGLQSGWVLARIKHIAKSVDSRRVPLSGEERADRQGVFPYYGASGVIDHIDDFIFNEATVLVGEDGANLLSRTTPLAFVATGKYWVNNHAHILQPLDGLHQFWAYAIEALDICEVVTGSAQPKLTIDALMNLPIQVPPLDIRVALQRQAVVEEERINALSEHVRAHIDRLREYRSSLISAAVTGQLDLGAFRESA